jgi:hypothetical protein
MNWKRYRKKLLWAFTKASQVQNERSLEAQGQDSGTLERNFNPGPFEHEEGPIVMVVMNAFEIDSSGFAVLVFFEIPAFMSKIGGLFKILTRYRLFWDNRRIFNIMAF